MISLIEEYAPNIRQIVEHGQELSPPDLERRFGITGGNIFHSEMTLLRNASSRSGLGALSNPGRRPAFMRIGRSPRRRCDERPRLQLCTRDVEEAIGAE